MAAPPATFGDVFAVGEFRALWFAQVLSVIGDQLARVALTLLVFDKTHSPLLAAVTFAASVVPPVAGRSDPFWNGGPVPRRRGHDLSAISACAALSHHGPAGGADRVLVGLLFLVTLISAPFTSARAALYPEILAGDRYVVGTAVTLTTLQFAQVLGFALAGVVVSSFGVTTSLVADAATFLVSAAITGYGCAPAPPPGSGAAGKASARRA